jgi:hypothetical protein
MKRLLPAAVLCAHAVSSGSAEIYPLANHRWNHRVLLVFANSEGDGDARVLGRALAASRCETEERDMVIGWIVQDGASRLGDAEISRETAGLLRESLEVAPGGFAVLLIGKDGGVKARYAEVPALAELFALIDGMPMRRSEMRSRPASCNE